jgi:predicted dehydrogenase
LVQNQFYSEIIEGQTGWAEFPTVLPDTPDVAHHPYQAQMTYFIDCILNGKTPMLNIKDAVKTHEICFAAEMSSRERKPIKLPLS